MSTSRRNFLKTSGFSVAALAIGSHKLFAAYPDKYIGHPALYCSGGYG